MLSSIYFIIATASTEMTSTETVTTSDKTSIASDTATSTELGQEPEQTGKLFMVLW